MSCWILREAQNDRIASGWSKPTHYPWASALARSGRIRGRWVSQRAEGIERHLISPRAPTRWPTPISSVLIWIVIARGAKRAVAIQLDCFVADAPRNDNEDTTRQSGSKLALDPTAGIESVSRSSAALIVYRLGQEILNLQSGVRFPVGAPSGPVSIWKEITSSRI